MTTTDAESAFRKFELQARQCEAFAARAPAAYKRRVIWLAALGYAFPPAVLALLLAVFAGLIGLYVAGGYHGGTWLIGKFGIALAVLIAMVVRAMWPHFEAPEGIRLNRSDAPDLLSLVDDVRAKAGTPRVDRVYVTDDLNAAIRQTPRLGLLGWYRNDLIVGLPLLQTLAKHEFAAVLAHEFGHISGAHGKLGAWIYRSRLVMARILSAIEARSYFGSWLFRWFYQWYEPYFAAYSFALARGQEYEADRIAADAVSPQAAIDALARVSIAARYVGGIFWREVWGRADNVAQPPENVFGRLGDALTSLSLWDGVPKSFEAALGEETGYADTHPSFSDRAKAIGAEIRIPPDAGEPGTSLLPSGGAYLVAELSQQWQSLVAEAWEDSHKRAAEQKRRLAKLDADAAQHALAEDDAMMRGLLAERFKGPEAALERFEQALTWTGGTARPAFALGRILLALGRDEGLTHLEEAMSQDDDAIAPACQLAEAYLMEAGRGDEAEAYKARRAAREEILQADLNERNKIWPRDTFVHHECDAESVNDIVRKVAVFKKKGLKNAWLVRKVTKHRQWEPVYILVCEIRAYKRWTEDMDELQEQMARRLLNHGELRVVICDVANTWLRDKAAAVSGAQIFPQP